MTEEPALTVLRLMPSCDLSSHQWEETYYGWKCLKCGDFVPFGCEPWSVDDDFEVH